METQIFSEKDQLWLNQLRTGSYSKRQLIRLLRCNIALRFVLIREVLLLLFSSPFVVFTCLLISSLGLKTWICLVYLVAHFIFYQFYLKYKLDGTFKIGINLLMKELKF